MVFHIRNRHSECQIALQIAQGGLQGQGFTQAKEVVGLIIQAKECTGKAAEAAIQSNGVLAFSLTFSSKFTVPLSASCCVSES